VPKLTPEDLNHVLSHTTGIWPNIEGPIFITGGTGFVGIWLVETLLWANAKLGLKLQATLLTRNPDGFARKAPHLAQDPAVTLLQGDAFSFPYPSGSYATVIHAATEQHAQPTAQQPVSTFDLDLEATRRVLEFARTHGAKRLLFTSSGAAYGKQPSSVTHTDEDYPGGPLTTDTQSVYGQAKRASEFFCSMYARQYGIGIPIARLFAFVGPHLPLDLAFAVGNFIGDVLKGGPIRIGGDGTPFRSYLYAADMAIWIWTLLVQGESGRFYNVGSDRDLTIAELAREVVANTVPGTAIEIARMPVPGAPPLRYVPSISRARQELGLEPLISLDEGIRRTYRWYRDCRS